MRINLFLWSRNKNVDGVSVKTFMPCNGGLEIFSDVIRLNFASIKLIMLNGVIINKFANKFSTKYLSCTRKGMTHQSELNGLLIFLKE